MSAAWAVAVRAGPITEAGSSLPRHRVGARHGDGDGPPHGHAVVPQAAAVGRPGGVPGPFLRHGDPAERGQRGFGQGQLRARTGRHRPRRVARQAARAVVSQVVPELAPGRVRPLGVRLVRPVQMPAAVPAPPPDRQPRRPRRHQAEDQQSGHHQAEHLPRVRARGVRGGRRVPDLALVQAATVAQLLAEVVSQERLVRAVAGRRARRGGRRGLRRGPGRGAAGLRRCRSARTRFPARPSRTGSARIAATRSPRSTAPARHARRGW